ncbi:hypothetical protein ACFS27_22825 [Promicromonospora vindobonensis]|uniref:Uncharacterized protein n=1 Tax=Promicromonospora vindobonensis TaxID=195748 RepID=A0ABW5VXL9_9MICO
MPDIDQRPLRQDKGLLPRHAADLFGVWPAIISTLKRGKSRNDGLATAYRE